VNIEYIPIKSDKSGVWFEFTLDEDRGELSFAQAWHASKRLRSVHGKKFAYPKSQVEQLDTAPDSRKLWYIMCDLQGDIKVLPEDSVRGEYLAHLGIINPREGKIQLLKFVEIE
jgi:hypothetical protein